MLCETTTKRPRQCLEMSVRGDKKKPHAADSFTGNVSNDDFATFAFDICTVRTSSVIRRMNDSVRRSLTTEPC